MVNITSNENNPSTLKLVIAAFYSKQEVKLNIITANASKTSHFPYFEVNGESVFTSNSGLLYLLPPNEERKHRVLEWLEWESILLTPTLAHVLGSSIKSKQMKENLKSYLKKLNSSLQNGQFLIDGSISACDVSIWSVIYPMVRDEQLSKEYLKETPNISIWFEAFEKQCRISESMNNYEVVPGLTAYQCLWNNANYIYGNGENKHVDSSLDQVDENATPEELSTAKEAWGKKANLKNSTANIPVLPRQGEKNILITSALPYVNNVPHLGNIIGCVLSADVFARFSRLCNRNVLYICGTDEYGTATETKALEENLTCQQICDKYFKIHESIYKWFNISFDHFGRTSTPEQTELCQDIFLKLNDNGFMFTESVEQLHCKNCDRFLADRFVEGGCPNVGCTYEDARGDQCDGCGKLVNAIELKNPRCKICGNTPEIQSSRQFFMDLPKLEPLLLHWFKKSSPGWSNNAQTIGKAWLKEGLKPRCITRDLKWGIPVPLNEYRNKVFYVWFDAPIGYMSITKAYTKEWEKWWKPESNTSVTLYNFMAKDNVPFHSIMFPATLLGCNRGYITVSHLMATEYLNYEDGKFSKSRGVGVFGTDAQDTNIPSDVWRFYLLFLRPESQDSNFNWSDLVTKSNSELLNNLGNFINRALMFVKNNFSKIVPKMDLNENDFNFLALCNRELETYMDLLEKAKLRDGLRCILAISKLGNQYMQYNKPWVLLKGSDAEKSRAGTVIGVSCNIVCLISIILSPYMPETSDNIRKQLNAPEFILTFDKGIVNFLPQGHVIGDPHPLFTKIEENLIEELKTKYAGKQKSASPEVVVDQVKLKKMIDDQALLVRKLKEGGSDKSVWQPEVAKLLALKAKLETKTEIEENPKDVEEEIARQASVVRKLKEGGAQKSVWQPEVDKLLALKKKLSQLTGVPLASSKQSKKN